MPWGTQGEEPRRGYMASPGKISRYEPCFTRNHMPICYMNKPSYLVPLMIALSWSSKLEHSESLSTSSFFQLCLSFHTLSCSPLYWPPNPQCICPFPSLWLAETLIFPLDSYNSIPVLMGCSFLFFSSFHLIFQIVRMVFLRYIR